MKVSRPILSQLPVASIIFRLLGAIYAIAFSSLAIQICGLVGPKGIVPAENTFRYIHEQVGAVAYLELPTLLWFSQSDIALRATAYVGLGASILLAAGFFPGLASFVCWLCFLSLINVGDVFTGFQWDSLLLEAGFLTIIVIPWSKKLPRNTVVPEVGVFLFRVLLFRLLFSSGLSKLVSGESAWRNLTALNFHYETQPIPNPASWFIHRMPELFHKISTVFMFVCELTVPFLFFGQRRLRAVGFALSVLLQAIILLTGNFAYFNWLTIILLLWLLDVREPKFGELWNQTTRPMRAMVLILLVSGFLSQLVHFVRVPVISRILAPVASFRITNGYGLFAVMTKERPEIVIEGSDDGKNWKEYPFRFKPGPLDRTPPWVAPHQPRLDWQLWFAALSDFEHEPWFASLVLKILQGEPEVMRLLAPPPFLKPPVFLRSRLYDYRFSTADEMRKGLWWRRIFVREYSPEFSLRNERSNDETKVQSH